MRALLGALLGFLLGCSILLSEAQDPPLNTEVSTVFLQPDGSFFTLSGVLYEFPVAPDGTVITNIVLFGQEYTGGIVDPDVIETAPSGQEVLTRRVKLVSN